MSEDISNPNDTNIPVAVSQLETLQSQAAVDASQSLADLTEGLRRLNVKFDDKIRNDATRNAIVDRLHAELQEYRNDLVFKAMRPLLLDLVLLHDQLGKALADFPESETENRTICLLRSYQQSIVDTLYRQGVESFTCGDELFDPSRQTAVRTIPAPEPALEGRIVERLRLGFASGKRVLRPEGVVVYTKASQAAIPEKTS